MQSNRKFEAFLQDELQKLAERQLLRHLTEPAGLDFCSNDYLSLNRDFLPECLQRLSVSFAERTGSTGSRLVRGNSKNFSRLEELFAEYAGYEAALFFNSGYAASTGCLPALIDSRDIVFCDRLSHASLLDGVRLSKARRVYFAHNNMDNLRERLEKERKRKTQGRFWIITETYFSMNGDSPDTNLLEKLAEEFDALLCLDEAHSVGVSGPAGRGLSHRIRQSVALALFPMGKAPGLCGAFACGSRTLIDFLIQRARTFIFSTALPEILPRLLQNVIEAFPGKEMERRRQLLQANIAFLRQGLRDTGLGTGSSYGHIVPVHAGSAAAALKMAQVLRKKGCDGRAIRPPTVPEGQSLIRISLQASHSAKELETLLSAFSGAL